MIPNIERLDSYFSSKYGKAFSNRLRALRNQLAQIDASEMDNKFGVDQTTFRGFHNWENPPCVLYRLWAERQVERMLPKKLAMRIKTREGFEGWHRSLELSLRNHWLVYQYESPPLAHILKLVDLFVKWISEHNFGVSQLTDALANNAHCALDSQTLTKMNACYSNAFPLHKPRMGNIKSRKTYNWCQEMIHRFSTQHGGTALLFDYYAWKKRG